MTSHKIEKKCINCNNTFFVYPSKSDKKFCSKKCYHSYPKPRGKESPQYKKITIKCDLCNKEYDEFPNKIKLNNKHYCSKDCYNKSQINTQKSTTKFIIKFCEICNKEIKRTEAEFKNKPAKNYYCSTECRDLKLKQTRGGFTPFTKICEYCKKEFTIDARNKRTRKYCSNECKKNGFPKENNHPNFKPELSRDYRSRHRLTHENTIWRTEVFKRNNYTCQICLKKGYKLQAHHLENYSSCKEKRFDIDNGVTLCKSCHKIFHSKYGVVRNTPEQFNEFKRAYKIQFQKHRGSTGKKQ